VLFRAVCTVEKERFQSSAKGRCRLCSFRQLVPRSRCGGGKCSIRRFPVCPWDDVVSPRLASRSEDRDEVAATGWSKSVMQSGDCPSDALWTIKHSLYTIRSLIGRQCSSRRAQLMWSRGLRSSTTRAATRRTRCNGARVDAERPASIALR